MVDGEEQNSINPIFFPVWFLLNVTFHYWATFLLLINVESFLWRYSRTHCCSWEYKSALSVWLWFKNLKEIVPWWSHNTHCTLLLFHKEIQMSIHCPFSSAVMIILRNGSFLCLERRLVTLNMQSSLFFSKKKEGPKYSAC